VTSESLAAVVESGSLEGRHQRKRKLEDGTLESYIDLEYVRGPYETDLPVVNHQPAGLCHDKSRKSPLCHDKIADVTITGHDKLDEISRAVEDGLLQCQECGNAYPKSEKGRAGKFCSDRCRKRASRT